MKTKFVIADDEWTTWEGAKVGDWAGPGQFREILRMGAIMVDWDHETRHGVPVKEFDMWMKPNINTVLSEFNLNLLNITQDKFKGEVATFPEGLEKFVEFCELDESDKPVITYGDDTGVKQENLALFNYMIDKEIISGQRRLKSFTADSRLCAHNIAGHFRFADPGMRNVGSGRLWEHFGLSRPQRLDGKVSKEHDPVFDCHSILLTMNHLSAQGYLMPIPGRTYAMKPKP